MAELAYKERVDFIVPEYSIGLRVTGEELQQVAGALESILGKHKPEATIYRTHTLPNPVPSDNEIPNFIPHRNPLTGELAGGTYNGESLMDVLCMEYSEDPVLIRITAGIGPYRGRDPEKAAEAVVDNVIRILDATPMDYEDQQELFQEASRLYYEQRKDSARLKENSEPVVQQ